MAKTDNICTARQIEISGCGAEDTELTDWLTEYQVRTQEQADWSLITFTTTVITRARGGVGPREGWWKEESPCLPEWWYFYIPPSPPLPRKSSTPGLLHLSKGRGGEEGGRREEGGETHKALCCPHSPHGRQRLWCVMWPPAANKCCCSHWKRPRLPVLAPRRLWMFKMYQ